MKTQRGFTLVEVMISLTLALILMAGVSRIFVDARSTYRLTENLNRTQENGRFAMFFITDEIRKAKQMGCAPTTVVNHLNNPTDYYQAGANIVGYTQANLPSVLSPSEVVPGTDVIAITRMADDIISVTAPYMTTTAGAVHVEPGSDLNEGDIVLITDCVTAELFQITAPSNPGANGTLVHGTGGNDYPGNAAKDFSRTYGAGSMVVRFITKYYYIGYDASGEPALFVLGDNAVLVDAELVGYIEDLRARYGQDTDADGSVDTYDFAAGVADWSQVITVQVSVVARTPEKVSVNHDYRRQTYGQTVYVHNYRK